MNPQSPKTSAPCTLPVEPAAAAATDDEAPAPPVAAANNTEPATIIREQDRLMPVANVSRIMRQVLPPYAKISDDAKEVIQECVSEFISFVTGEANERCHAERRKTVTSEDIVWAMDRLGFDDFVAPISTFLHRMRESEGGEEQRGPGRGSRRGGSTVAALNNAAAVCRQQPHQGVPPAAAAGYAVRPPLVPRPVPSTGGAAPPPPQHFGGGRSYQQMYGPPAFVVQAGGSSQHVGFHAGEASSSNEIPPAGRAAGSH